MQIEPKSFLDRHGYLLLAQPGVVVPTLAIVLFESSSNMSVSDFKQSLVSLMQPNPLS